MLQSYDPTTHFETTVQDVLSMYTRITGKVSVFPLFQPILNIVVRVYLGGLGFTLQMFFLYMIASCI